MKAPLTSFLSALAEFSEFGELWEQIAPSTFTPTRNDGQTPRGPDTSSAEYYKQLYEASQGALPCIRTV